MIEPPVQALLADIDGTLVISNFAHAAAWSSALTAHGFDISPETMRPRIGMGADRILAGLHPGLDANSEIAKEIERERKRIFLGEYLPGILSAPGARDLLGTLHSLGIRIVVATSAGDDERDALLYIARVRDFVEFPQASPDKSKPDPDIVLAALEQSGAAVSTACMIGDAPYDIDAANTAGIRIVAVRCGGWDDRSLSRAFMVYGEPADALAHLPEWTGLHAFQAPRKV